MSRLRPLVGLGCCALLLSGSAVRAQEFRRGDANSDGAVGVADLVFVASFLFGGGAGGAPSACLNASDADDSGAVDAADIVEIAAYLTGAADELAPPGPRVCGQDPTPTPGLECLSYPCDEPTPGPRSPLYRLSFAAPTEATSSSGTGAAVEAAVILENDAPVRAWSVAVRSNCPLGAATTERTAAAEVGAEPPGFREAGFEHTDVVPAGEGSGVLSAVVLSFVSPVELPVGEPHTLLRFEVEGVAPFGGCGTCSLDFHDRLRGRESRLANRLTRTGSDPFGLPAVESVRPQVAGHLIRVCCVGEEFDWGEGIELELSPESPGACLTFRPPAVDDVGKVVVLSLEDPDPGDANAVYARWARPASPTSFDHAADRRSRASQRLVIPFARQEELHVTVRGTRFAGKRSALRLTATLGNIGAGEIFPTRAARGSRIAAVITGGGFDGESRFLLVHQASGRSVPGVVSRRLSASRVEVEFGLENAAPGTYRLVARRGVLPAPGFESTRENAFEVLPARLGARLQVKVDAPARYRVDRVRVLTLRYENAGDREMEAPYLKIVPPPGTEIRLLDDESFQNELHVLGIQRGGVPGKLAPGSRVEVPVAFRSRRVGPGRFEVHLLTPRDDDVVDWDQLPAPAGMSPESWSKARPQLARDLGETWLDVRGSLASLASRLAPRGVPVASVRRLFRFAVRRALGRPSVAAGGTVRDDVGAPVAGRSVLAVSGDTVRTSTVTDSDGRFALDWLSAGQTYRLAVEGYDVGVVQLTPISGDIFGLELRGVPDVVGLSPACADCDESDLPEAPVYPADALFARVAQADITVISSRDPNSKDGPAGQGKGGFIAPEETLDYTVHFENIAAGPGGERFTVAAQEVLITDFLDVDLNDESIRFRAVGFGDTVVDLDGGGGRDLFSGYSESPNSSRYAVSVEEPITTPEGDFVVRIDASYESASRTLRWFFQTQDPGTGFRTVIDEAGFLPVNDGSGRGEGFVSFTIDVRQEDEVPEGCEEVPEECETIENDADITFDTNEFISTDSVINPIATNLPPATPRNPLPPDLRDLPLARPVSIRVLLGWEPSDRATVYEVLFWQDGEPRPASGTQTPIPSLLVAVPLLPGEVYRWQVLAFSDSERVEGPEWRFETELRVVLFVRGDVDASGVVDLSDAVFALNHLFLGGPEPRCLDAADANDDGRFDLSDAVSVLGYLFLGSAAPPPPAPSRTSYDRADCGRDPSDVLGSPDGLDCALFRPCLPDV